MVHKQKRNGSMRLWTKNNDGNKFDAIAEIDSHDVNSENGQARRIGVIVDEESRGSRGEFGGKT
jgi:hypothetical protein